MKLFIAEKPTLGRAIADALPGTKHKHGNTHIELSNGDVVSWAFGHILEQAPPEEYDAKFKKWDLKHLPIKVSNWKLQQKNDSKAQLAKLKELIAKADVIVNAGDPDREGQLIVDEIIDYLGFSKKPQQRLWLNAVDMASTKKALGLMEDNKNKKYVNLSASALCRQRADWLVGMNMSRAVTLCISSNQAASIGRVQTPTLAMVVNRCIEIENFKAKNFYEIEIEVESGKDLVKLAFSTTDHDKRLWDKAAAEKIAAAIQGRSTKLGVISVERTTNPPPLFHLPDFQKFASKTMKWGVQKSLAVLQELYEAKLTSYPRTESNKLPVEQEPDGLPIGKGLISTGKFANAKDVTLATKSYVYSCGKDEAHHAIVPTKELPSSFASKDMEAAWMEVAKRFLMSLMPAYKFTETVISVKEEGLTFVTKGEVPLTNPAKTWLALSDEQRKAVAVPGVKDGASGVIKSAKVIAKSTSCPEYYTEATLLEDMRSIAKFVTNEKLKAILKENSGIGTAATQAAIIGRIQQQGYVQKDGQKLKDTPFGRTLILNLPNQLKDPCLTAAWEDALKMIAAGDYSPVEFMDRIDVFVESRLRELTAMKGSVVLSADKTIKKSKPLSQKARASDAKRAPQSKQKPLPPGTSAHTRALSEF